MMMIKMKKVRVGEKFNLIDCEFVEVPWTLTWKYFDRNFESTGEERFNKYLKTDWKNEKLEKSRLSVKSKLIYPSQWDPIFNFHSLVHFTVRLVWSCRVLALSAHLLTLNIHLSDTRIIKWNLNETNIEKSLNYSSTSSDSSEVSRTLRLIIFLAKPLAHLRASIEFE